MKTMYCPFMDAQIDSETCLEITMAANGEETGRVRDDDALTAAMRDKKRKKTCMHCQWHTVYCLVKNDQINGADCYEVCEVADNMVSENILPEGILWNEKQKEKCLHCKWHGDVKD